MKKILLLVLLLFISKLSAQNESDNWYFGNNAGLNFSTGNPVALTDGKMSTFEGCATISDNSGKLLFYTDGITVWNKNHQIMPNGTKLKGNSSTTQSAIIIPKPGSTTIYFIFTCAMQAEPDGLQYSVVDMTLNSGLGDITSQKNILLATPVCEKLTAVKNEISNEYWVMAHGYGNNQFLAYKVTTAGVHSTPITSNVGIVVDTEDRKTVGYLKFSPQGKKLISCNNFNNGVELYDFDASTGIVTNPRKVNNQFYNYGVEFSPSEKIAYVSGGIGESIQLFQYDLTAVDIPSTEIIIQDRIYNGFFFNYFEAMQLAKNGKIYGALLGTEYVFSIEKPNILGPGCNFILNSVSLGTGICQYGLPQFIQSYFKINAKIDVKNNCLGETSTFSISSDQAIVNVEWDFGDGTTSTDINPNHLYANSGLYTVSATINSGTPITETITISKTPTASKPTDLLVCDNNNDGYFSFDLTTQNSVILDGQDPNLFSIKYFSNGQLISSPTTYNNTTAFKKELIVADVFNKSNVDCKSSTSFYINVFETPQPNIPGSIPELAICDNTSIGTDDDQLVIFDLTQRSIDILNGQSVTQFTMSYYKDALMTQEIILPDKYQNTSGTETIFVKVTNKDNLNCTAKTSFKLRVFALPVITSSVSLRQCDDDIDGFTFFNLEEGIKKITANSAVETVTFHESYNQALTAINPILNQTAYRNKTVSSDKVYVRIINKNNCFRIAELNLIVSTTQIPATYSKVFAKCDDTISGNDSDGIASFDFSSVTTDLKENVFPSGQLLDISYYQSIDDAMSEKNAISDMSNYQNSSSPNLQKIFIRVDSKLNNDCLGLGGYITLKVEPIPIAKKLTKNHCDDNQDGLYAFDTSNIEQELLNGLTNVTVSYFDQNNTSLSSPLPNPFVTNSQTLKVVITNKTALACSFDSTISFIVDQLPQVYPIAAELTTVCDDEADPLLQDGKYAFNTSAFESILLDSQTGMKINYYDSENNPLQSPLPNPFLSASQKIKAEVVNTVNNTCTASTVISFVVNPVPKINLKGEELVCSNLPTFTKQIDVGLADPNEINDYEYKWFFNGDLIHNETDYKLIVNKEGTYTAEVSNKLTNCSRIRTIKVAASDIASNIIAAVNESNTISVSVSGNGDYLYALDDQNGDYQIENTFQNVPAGIHIVYVKDQNGCGISSKEVPVFGIPKFFTPNQDGHNDYWNIEGVDQISKTIIQIFDRYGKFIAQIDPLSSGWDGNYLGRQMPSDDYWYFIKLADERIFKGHFTLKR